MLDIINELFQWIQSNPEPFGLIIGVVVGLLTFIIVYTRLKHRYTDADAAVGAAVGAGVAGAGVAGAGVAGAGVAGAGVVVVVVVVAGALANIISKILSPNNKSEAENAAKYERHRAASIKNVTKRFDESARDALDKAVSGIRKTAHERIKEKLDSLIEEKYGDGVSQALGEQVAQQAKGYTDKKQLDDYFENTKEDCNIRVLQYTDNLHNQSERFRNLATMLAFFGVLIALTILFITFLPNLASDPTTSPNPSLNFANVAYRYLPVYMTVILCEVLALVLFRVSGKLSEQVRYFSNEATNNDYKFTALKIGLHYDKIDDLISMAKVMQKTERNFVLNKGQTTMEQSANELEANHLENLIAQLKSALPNQAKKTTRKPKTKATPNG